MREEAAKTASELQTQVATLREQLVVATTDAQRHGRHVADLQRQLQVRGKGGGWTSRVVVG